MQSGSINTSTNVLINNSAVGIVSGTYTGNLLVTGTFGSGGLATLDSLSVTHAMSINGGLTVVGTTGITGASSGITMQDIQATRSMGVGSAGVATGVNGQLAIGASAVIGAPTGGFQSGSLNAATNLLVNNASIGIVGGVYTGNLSVTGTLGSGGLATLGSLSVTGAASMNGGLTMVGATGITGSSSGLTMRDIQASRSMGVGSGGVANGVDGQLAIGNAITIGSPSGGMVGGSLNAATSVLVNGTSVGIAGGTYTGNLTVTGTLTSGGLMTANSLSVTGASSMNGGLTMVGATGITGTSAGLVMLDIQANRSLGVGTAAIGVTGALNVAGNTAIGGTLGVTSSSTLTGAVSTGSSLSMGGNLTLNSHDISGVGQIGASGNIQTTAGTIYALAGGIIGANLQANTSLGVGSTPASGTTGRVDISSGIYLNGTAYTNP